MCVGFGGGWVYSSETITALALASAGDQIRAELVNRNYSSTVDKSFISNIYSLEILFGSS